MKLSSKHALAVILSLMLVWAAAAFAQDRHGQHRTSSQTAALIGFFDAMMDEAMTRMHRDMAVPATGDPDRDFAAMMIPHHQGAVDMARIQLQFGKDPVLRRLAQGIIVEQLQEIDVMRRQLEQFPVKPASAQPSDQNHSHTDSKGH